MDPASGILILEGWEVLSCPREEETCDRMGVAVADWWLREGHSREWNLLWKPDGFKVQLKL